jgi:hypothetical protein
MRVFISYRRDDTQYVAGRVYDWLEREFGAENVFKDVDSIPLGVDFRRAIQAAVSSCDVLLVLLGPRWRANAAGDPDRLEDEADFVRIEVETALQRDIPIIPLLIDKTQLPKPKELPPSLGLLAYRNGMNLRPDPDFRQDMKRLTEAIHRLTGPAPTASGSSGVSPRSESPVQPSSTSEGSSSVPKAEGVGRSGSLGGAVQVPETSAGPPLRTVAWITFLALLVLTPFSCWTGRANVDVNNVYLSAFGWIMYVACLTLLVTSYRVLRKVGFTPLRAGFLGFAILAATVITILITSYMRGGR